MSQQVTAKQANDAIHIAHLLKRRTGRHPVYDPGAYQNYATSKSVTCWGNPVKLDGFLVAASQPSPQKAGDKLFVYFDFIEDENAFLKKKKQKKYQKCVHTQHCCIEHGCKYGYPDCPVWLAVKPQSYPCERCENDITLPVTKAELKRRKQECQPIV